MFKNWHIFHINTVNIKYIQYYINWEKKLNKEDSIKFCHKKTKQILFFVGCGVWSLNTNHLIDLTLQMHDYEDDVRVCVYNFVRSAKIPQLIKMSSFSYQEGYRATLKNQNEILTQTQIKVNVGLSKTDDITVRLSRVIILTSQHLNNVGVQYTAVRMEKSACYFCCFTNPRIIIIVIIIMWLIELPVFFVESHWEQNK